MDFLQAQMKNDPLVNPKNKIKLPLISSTKQTISPNNITDEDFQKTPTSDVQKLSNTKNI